MTEVNGATVVADLANALPADTGMLHTVFPGTNKRTGWNIVIAGPGHPKSIALSNEKERERLQKAQQIERAQVNGRKWKGDEDKQPQDSRREFISDLVGRIVSWTPVNFGDGAVEFAEGDVSAPKRAIDLLVQPKMGPYVGQIVDYLLDERSFMKGSASD